MGLLKRGFKWWLKKLIKNYYLLKYHVLGYTELKVVKGDKDYKYDVCVIIGYGWNFLDAQLPALFKLKKKNARICTIIPFCNAYALAEAERVRFSYLEKVSDCLILNMSACGVTSRVERMIYDIKSTMQSEGIMQVYRTLEKFQIRTFFAIDDSEIIPLVKSIKRNRRDDLSSFFVAGFCVDYFGIWGDNYLFDDELYKDENTFDCYLIPNLEGYRNVEKCRNKLCLCGAPRLDLWWRQMITNAEDYCAFLRKLKKRKKKIIVHVFSVVVDYVRFTECERKMFYEAMEELKDYTHVFKFHPRDTQDIRKKFIDEFIPNGIEWCETTYDFVQLFDLADLFLIVGMTASSIGLLASGKPQIEFYDDSTNHGVFLKVSERRYVQYNEYHGLAIHANNNMELVKLVREVFETDIWERVYKNKALSLFNLDNCASERVANILLSGRPQYTLENVDTNKWFRGF